jgi:hypothetical protein
MKLNTFILLALVSTAVAQNPQRLGYVVQNNAGFLKVIPNASIVLCQYNTELQCNIPVTIFSDSALTQPIGYPFYADANGYFNYYEAPGTYVETQSGTPFLVTLVGGTGTGTGSVTSVSTSGYPLSLGTVSVTNPTTTPALVFVAPTYSQNFFLAGPTSGSGNPGPRAIVPGDLPTATSSALGIVKPDNTTITISGGVLSSVSSGLSGQTAGCVPQATSTTASTDSAPICNTGSLIQIALALQVNDGSGAAGSYSMSQGTLISNLTNNITLTAPTSVTAYRIELPGVEPTSGHTFLSCTAADPAVCSWAGTGITTPVSIANGGTGTGSTLTGLVRGNSSAMTAAELSGDATTSGSNAVTVVKINGVAVTGTPTSGQIPTATSGTAATWQTPSGGGGGAWTNITDTVTVSGCTASAGICVVGSGGSATVTFSSIPGTYNHLVLEIEAQCSSGSTSDHLTFEANADTAANYLYQYLLGNSSAADAGNQGGSAVAAPLAGDLSCSGSSLNPYSMFTINIPYYSSTSFGVKNADIDDTTFAWSGGSFTNSTLVEKWMWWWHNSAAITSLAFAVSGGSNFVQNSKFTIYGIN